jgi:hypothetical protein
MGVLEEQQVADANWRRDVDRRLDQHFERLESGEERMNAMALQVEENTTITREGRDIAKAVKDDTAELVKVANAFKGAATVMGWLQKSILFLAAMLVAGGILWWFVKTGEIPKKP